MKGKIKYFFFQFFYNYSKLHLSFYILIFEINVILNECDRDNPFLIINENECTSFCYSDDLKDNKCILDNGILKDQYPNNIIFIGPEINNKFNFYSFSNGDFLFESFYSRYEKIFFGLKKNGRHFFNNDRNDSYILVTQNREFSALPDSVSIFNNNNEEYLLNIDPNQYTEIYNINMGIKYSINTSNLLGFDDYNRRGNLLYISNNTHIYTACQKESYNYYPTIIKFSLSLRGTNEIDSSIISKQKISIKNMDNIISCFKTEKNGYIICFSDYSEGINYYTNKYFYYIIAYTQDLIKLCDYSQFIEKNTNSFIYSIAFKNDAGAFIYFQYDYPLIFFKEYQYSNNSFRNYFYEINEIKLDKFPFDKTEYKNDFIKISDNKLGLFSASTNSEILYIVIISIFYNNVNLNFVKIRYYSIELYKILNYNLRKNIRAHIFNDFIVLGAGYELIEKNKHFSGVSIIHSLPNSLMLIGYPNKNDSSFDIIEKIKDNRFSISNLIIYLTEGMKIDNNLFGYQYKGIKINQISKYGNIYLESDENELIDYSNNSVIYKSDKFNIRFMNNSYIKSQYLLDYSIIVTESDFQENEKYPIEIIDYFGYENQVIFNERKKVYIGKSIYYNIILSQDLSEDCNNPRCSLCYKINNECISLKSTIETKILNAKKQFFDLELLYSLIIIFLISLFIYFIFYSFQNLRIIFFIFQLIIFLVITFNSKYKNHYLWNDRKFEAIQETPHPIITDFIKTFNYSTFSYDLVPIMSYQNFSIENTVEYSKECLLNYFIKESDICPITDVIINSDNNLIGYLTLNIYDNYIHYRRDNKYGKLFNSYTKTINPGYKYNISFTSKMDYKNISIIKILEKNKLSNPFSKLKKYCYFSDTIWLFLFPISLIYYFIESRDDKKWNYFKIIDYSLQVILLVIYIIRFIFFVEVKNFYRKNKDEIKIIDNSLDLKDFENYKNKISYKPNFYINAESFPVAIGISMIFYFVLFLLTREKKYSCQKKNYGDEKYNFFDDKRKFRIYYLLSPLILLYFIAFIFDIINDVKLKKIFNNTIDNWELSPITGIQLSNKRSYELAHIFLEDKNYLFYSWRDNFISIERNDKYNYMNLHLEKNYINLTNSNYTLETDRLISYKSNNSYMKENGKICGKDSFGNDLYFPESKVCPINHIYIDNIFFGLNEFYKNINLGNNYFLHYTNTKIDGQILVDLRVGPSSIPLELNSNNTNELCEITKSDLNFKGKCKNYYKFNTIPFYIGIDSLKDNNFNESSELIINNNSNVVLYALTYQGLNSTEINKNAIINYKKKINNLISLSIVKNIFSGFHILIFIYFSFVLLSENTKKSIFFYISIFLILFQIAQLILLSICFNINVEYIQSFMNKINKDFESHKISYIWTLLLIIFIIVYLFLYIGIIFYVFLTGENSLFKIFDKKENKNEHKRMGSVIEKISEEDNKCTICYHNKPEVIFAPCGHKCICKECFEKNSNLMKTCPICRNNIQSHIDKIFNI